MSVTQANDDQIIRLLILAPDTDPTFLQMVHDCLSPLVSDQMRIITRTTLTDLVKEVTNGRLLANVVLIDAHGFNLSPTDLIAVCKLMPDCSFLVVTKDLSMVSETLGAGLKIEYVFKPVADCSHIFVELYTLIVRQRIANRQNKSNTLLNRIEELANSIWDVTSKLSQTAVVLHVPVPVPISAHSASQITIPYPVSLPMSVPVVAPQSSHV